MPYPKNRIMHSKVQRSCSTSFPSSKQSKPAHHVRSLSCPDSRLDRNLIGVIVDPRSAHKPSHSADSSGTSMADFVTAEDILASRMAAQLAVARLEATIAAEERQRVALYSQTQSYPQTPAYSQAQTYPTTASRGWQRRPSLPPPSRPEPVSHYALLRHHQAANALHRPPTPPQPRAYTSPSPPRKYESPTAVGSTSFASPACPPSLSRSYPVDPKSDFGGTTTKINCDQEGEEGRCYIDDVTDMDILCGRGGKSNHHPGNKKYRQVVGYMKYKYQNCPAKTQKTDLSRQIVDYCYSYGGRFVKKDGQNARYYVLNKDEARKKTSQALRETKVLKWIS